MTLGMISRTICSTDKKESYWTCARKLVRSHLECCCPACSPYYSKDKQLLERTQHRFTRMNAGLKDLKCEEILKDLGIWSLEERRNRTDPRYSGRYSKWRVVFLPSHSTNFLKLINSRKHEVNLGRFLSKLRSTEVFLFRSSDRSMEQSRSGCHWLRKFKWLQKQIGKWRSKKMSFFMD